jgi:stearoyl-CoA desaturase (delta-9 desaturase)
MSAVTDDRLCWSSIGGHHALRDLSSVRSVRWQHRWYAAVAIGTGLALPTPISTLWGDPWGGLLVAGLLRAA